MRRRQTRVPNAAHRTLEFVDGQAAQGPHGKRRGRFVDDAPWHLYVGEERVDEYLRRRGQGWIVALRGELDRLDYTCLLVSYDAIGRRPYHPRTVLGLIVYGMLRQQWSLRELEELAALDVGAWWICGGQQPDHSTIGDFIERHKAVLSEEFFAGLLRDLVGRKGVKPGGTTGDGTVIESMASRYRLLTAEAAEQAAERARQAALEQPAQQEVAAAAEQTAALARERLRNREGKRRVAGGEVVAASDPEAVIQPRKDGARRPSYRPSLLVHESGLIVGQHVHASSETAAVAKLLEQHEAAFGAPPAHLLLDGAYHAIELLRELVARDIDGLCPAGKTDTGTWQKHGAHGRFGKGAFVYHEERNAYRCPAGQWLAARRRVCDREGRLYWEYRTAACRGCALRQQCTASGHGRTVARYVGDEYKEAMAEVLRHPRARQLYRRRAPIAERPFAELRGRQGLGRFHRRGLRGTGVEFALHCIAFNLKWAIGAPGALFIALLAHHRQRWHCLGVVAVCF